MIIFLAYKIHCSDATHEVLVAMGGFLFEPRGTIEVKVSKNCLTKCGSRVSCLVQAGFAVTFGKEVPYIPNYSL